MTPLTTFSSIYSLSLSIVDSNAIVTLDSFNNIISYGNSL